MLKKLKHHWTIGELVTIGIFAAAAKVVSLVVALAGGGMNPITLMLKNLIFTTFFMVMLFKVRKGGTMILFTFVCMLVSLLLMGAEVSTAFGMFIGSFVAEIFVLLSGGMKKTYAPVVGVVVFDLAFRVISIMLSFIILRERPEIVWAVIPIIAIGYIGAVIGIWAGIKSVKELRHAGIVRN